MWNMSGDVKPRRPQKKKSCIDENVYTKDIAGFAASEQIDKVT